MAPKNPHHGGWSILGMTITLLVILGSLWYCEVPR